MTLDNSDLDLMNSRPLDGHRWSLYPEVNDFVDEVYSTLKTIKGHQSTGKKLIKVLLLAALSLSSYSMTPQVHRSDVLHRLQPQ